MLRTEKDRGMAGGCLTHGGRGGGGGGCTRGDRAAGNADRPFVLFFVKGNLCPRAYLFSNSRNATDAIYTRHRVQLYIPAAR